MIWIKWLNTKNVCQTCIYIWHMSTHVKLITTNARSVSEYFQSYLDQSKYGCQELDNLFRYVIQNPSKIAYLRLRIDKILKSKYENSTFKG